MEVGSVTTSLMEVCNGTTFWTHTKLPSGESFSKLDAVRALAALELVAGRTPREALASALDWAAWDA